jgi:type IV fimbrial biogenesis protein FimT
MVRAQHGFNLIEVMVSLTVLGILISLGVPSFAEWLQSQRIRASAEAIINGLQVARGEAIRRNLPVVVARAPSTGGWRARPRSRPATPRRRRPASSVNPARGSATKIAQTPGDVTAHAFTLGAVLIKSRRHAAGYKSTLT